MLEKRCHEYLVNIDTMNSNYEDLKQQLIRNNNSSKIENNLHYEDRINYMNQALIEQERKMENIINENESLKNRVEILNNQINSFENEKKYMISCVDQIKAQNQ